MHDIFTAALLTGLLSHRHSDEGRRPEPQPERESPWARVFAWHRRIANHRA